MAVGAPLPGNVYYGLPSDHYFGSYFPAYFGSAFSPIKYTLGAIAPKQTHLILKPDNSELEKQDDTTSAPVQEIKLIIGIPVIPEGSSVSINVKVDSLPSGPVVSVSNPTTITGSPATPDDAIIVDVGVDGGSEEVDEEFEIREPPPATGENLFENSKDSPFLASMLSG